MEYQSSVDDPQCSGRWLRQLAGRVPQHREMYDSLHPHTERRTPSKTTFWAPRYRRIFWLKRRQIGHCHRQSLEPVLFSFIGIRPVRLSSSAELFRMQWRKWAQQQRQRESQGAKTARWLGLQPRSHPCVSIAGRLRHDLSQCDDAGRQRGTQRYGSVWTDPEGEEQTARHLPVIRAHSSNTLKMIKRPALSRIKAGLCTLSHLS